MNYIVLDLEWNQSNKPEEREASGLPFEIIEIGAIKICDGKITNYNYIMYSFTARARYNDLIRLLTRKSLKEKGFNPCPYGIGIGEESAWQEADKRQARLEEEKKKFPWL